MVRILATVMALVLVSGPSAFAGVQDGDPPIGCWDHETGLASDAGAGRDATLEDPILLPGPGTYEACVDTGPLRPSLTEYPFSDERDLFLIPADVGDRVRVTIRPIQCIKAWFFLQDTWNGSPHNMDSAERPVRNACATLELAATVRSPDGVALYVRANTASQGHYAFDVEVGQLESVCDPQNDAGTGSDAPEGPAPQITIGDHAGCIDGFEPEYGTQQYDRFSFDVQAGDLVRATVTPETCEPFSGYLHNTQQAVHRMNHWDRQYEFCEPMVLGLTAQQSGPTYLAIVRDHGGTIAYGFTVETASTLPRACSVANDIGTGQDAGAQAIAVLTPGSHVFCVDEFDPYDAFRINLAAGEAVTIKASTASGECWFASSSVRTGPPQDDRVGSSSIPPCSSSWTWRVNAFDEPVSYYLGFERANRGGDVVLNVCSTMVPGTECTGAFI